MSQNSTAHSTPPSTDPPPLQEPEPPAAEKALEIEIYEVRQNLQRVAPELAEVFPCK